MCPEYVVRPVTIAEQAIAAAKRVADTGEPALNPHPEGSDAYRKWNVCFKRAMQMQAQCDDCQGGA